MKFKKAGNVFEDIGDAFRAIEKVGGMSRHEDRDAVLAWVYAHPAEAARLMGYEVVEEETSMDKQDKPLSEWTLGEIQQHCNKAISCFNCKFTGICFDNVSAWDLTEEPREPASPERRGRWEEKKYIVFDLEKTAFRCSECKTTWDAATKYCSNCGAWMQTE